MTWNQHSPPPEGSGEAPSTLESPDAPQDFRWHCVWRESLKVGFWIAGGTAFAVAIWPPLTGFSLSPWILPAAYFASVGIAAGSASRIALSRHPQISPLELDQSTAATLRQPWLYTIFVASFLPIFATLALLGNSTDESEVILYSMIGIAIVVPALVLAIWSRRSAQLILSPNSFRAVTPTYDWEFPWDAVTALETGDDREGLATIKIHCARTAMISRRSRFRTPESSIPPRSSDNGPWAITPASWGASPNSLISVLIYLRTHDEARNTLSHAQLRAMLKPPPARVRRQVSSTAGSGARTPEFRFQVDNP